MVNTASPWYIPPEEREAFDKNRPVLTMAELFMLPLEEMIGKRVRVNISGAIKQQLEVIDAMENGDGEE